jgi:type IV secretory pathway ATPase VirB11/archaellum biosynthesis ATPase
MRKACGTYEVEREGDEIIVRVDCEECPYFPSIEDEPQAMSMITDILAEVGKATRIIISQKRDYEYDEAQTEILAEVADVYRRILRQKPTHGLAADPICSRVLASRIANLGTLIHTDLKQDPLGAYVHLTREIRHEKAALERGVSHDQCFKKYISLIGDILVKLDKTKLVQTAKPYLSGWKPGDRKIYRRLFSPFIKPDFMFAKLMSTYPSSGKELAAYRIDGISVNVFDVPETIQPMYHVTPPEFKLSEEKYALLDAARKIMAEHEPKRSEFVDHKRMRNVFKRVGADLLDELAAGQGIRLLEKDREILSSILVRYTIGFGLIEILMQDVKVQDITINSPMGKTPIFIIHADYGECFTNIIPSPQEAESWASKLRLMSGRPLDEANPILDTELEIPGARARVAAITAPLNPSGLAFALRRHRDKPWTLPLFIQNKMLTPLAAGVLSFLIDGARTLLVAGTRSAGKTSLLGSLMVEIMRKHRIITIEDTLELPVAALRDMNYNLQSMKVASALTRGTTDVSAEEGIRTTLRLGDSALVVGEVRSTEAKALYEAMRVGALANVVMGTIHGDSPYGVFDRVVNDLGVPRTSFKATDIIIVANPVKSPDGLHRWRRVTQITEVRKFWEDDPLRENGFVDLFTYDAEKDELVPTPELIAGDCEVLKSIGGKVKDWAGNWEAIWENIELRAKIKKEIVDYADKNDRKDVLEAEFSVHANDAFHEISEQVREEEGILNTDRIFKDWMSWMKRHVQK